MYMPYPISIGLRYAMSGRRYRFVSLISVTSVMGLAVGVMALITVLSVMNGFERELRQRIVGLVAHATVYGDAQVMLDWRAAASRLATADGIVQVAPVVYGEGMLLSGSHLQGVAVRGIDPEAEAALSSLDENMVQGAVTDLRPGDFSVILGRALADSMRLTVDDHVVMLTPEVRGGLTGITPRLRRMRVAGVFDAGMYEYDSALAFVHLDDAMRLFRKKRVDGLTVETTDMMQAPALSRSAAAVLSGQTFVVDWTQRHSSFFRALRIEKRVMFVILTLIVAVAAFNIVSMLMISVVNRQGQIAVLRSIGAGRTGIIATFVTQGAVVALAGIALGAAAGVWLAANVEWLVVWLEEMLGTRFLAPDIYYIHDLPSHLLWDDVVAVTGLSFVLCLLASLYPAWIASLVRPAEVLRYE